MLGISGDISAETINTISFEDSLKLDTRHNFKNTVIYVDRTTPTSTNKF